MGKNRTMQVKNDRLKKLQTIESNRRKNDEVAFEVYMGQTMFQPDSFSTPEYRNKYNNFKRSQINYQDKALKKRERFVIQYLQLV